MVELKTSKTRKGEAERVKTHAQHPSLSDSRRACDERKESKSEQGSKWIATAYDS